MLKRILVANRGEIACRILRACKEAEIESVAIFAANDAGTLFTELADIAIQLEGYGLAETYLNQQQILEIAVEQGCDSIHPGFGFLSERADFAQAVIDSGLIWIGPSPEAIAKMGDKITARIVMKEAGVPVIPGEEVDGGIEQIIAAAPSVGYPLLLKATAGGGGKGMRVVYDEADLETEAKAAMREAFNAFGDDRIYVEKLLTGSRHIEIQILADKSGRTIHLGERECSVQRRHQKVFEESPSVALDSELREAMGEAACAAARAVNYEGAGTVEFLVTPIGEFFFLEMNTRIQVEHPVTEMVTGVDLVREQLRIASGEPMSCGQLSMRGHAIEVRLYAEDPANNFLPAIGKLKRFVSPTGPGIRLDTGVRQGDEVTPDYDPMLAKLIVWAPSRKESLQRMARALDEFVILGCTTNVRFLRELCDHPDVVDGWTTTDMIERLWPEGWNPDMELSISSAGLLIASACESSNYGRIIQHSSGEVGKISPFSTINRRLP
ncbi:MAG: biotin carboxylase N-terminal domain-containing protein [Candidatus Poseidoniaceae archaeon]|nr:biotin carboxylase N-terminal domain-containing protein [Candidatus Poseidoniaceae archaeon]